MENQHPNIDEIFRQRLHDSEVPPPPFVWPAVEQALQKRRRRGMFLWLFAFGTAAACAVLLWQSDWWNHNAGTEQALVQQLEATHSAQESVPIATQESASAPVAASTPREIVAANSANVVDVPEGNDAKTAKKSPENGHFANKTKRNQKNIASDKAVREAQQTNIAALPAAMAPDATVVNPELSGNDLQSQASNESQLSTATLAQSGLESVASLEAQKPGFFPRSYKSHARRKKAQPKLCYDFAKHPSAWLLDVYAGPSLAQRSLTSRLDDEPYLNQRLATEHQSTAFNAGARASLMFNRNLLIRSGLHYDQITEVFEFIDPTSVIYILKFNPGDPTPDTLGVQYGENYLKTYNRYSMLDIPLMVGMEMRHGRSGFSINAGLSANVLFKKSGVIIDPLTQEPARFGPIPAKGVGPKTGPSQDVFRSNVGLSATASIQWYWHLTPHFRLFAEPSFRQVLRPVSVENHPVEQRYSIFGLRLGATTIF